MVTGRLSPARRIVITKIPRPAKLIQKSLLISVAPMSWPLVKHAPCFLKVTACLSKGTARKINYYRKHPTCFSAKESRDESCSATIKMERSTLSSTAETTKTLSGAKNLEHLERLFEKPMANSATAPGWEG